MRVLLHLVHQVAHDRPGDPLQRSLALVRRAELVGADPQPVAPLLGQVADQAVLDEHRRAAGTWWSGAARARLPPHRPAPARAGGPAPPAPRAPGPPPAPQTSWPPSHRTRAHRDPAHRDPGPSRPGPLRPGPFEARVVSRQCLRSETHRSATALSARPGAGVEWRHGTSRHGVTVGAGPLGLAEVVDVARHGSRVEVSGPGLAEVRATRAMIEGLAEDPEPHYGISTGFGALATRHIPVERRAQLQRSLIRSHAAGSGAEVEREVVRALMLLRISTLATGRTGVREETLRAYVALLNAGITPVVHEYGSLGCSGDLAPLAHCALALMGEGVVRDADGSPLPAGRGAGRRRARAGRAGREGGSGADQRHRRDARHAGAGDHRPAPAADHRRHRRGDERRGAARHRRRVRRRPARAAAASRARPPRRPTCAG